MTFEVDFKAHLSADSGITALVGGRIFPVIAPEDAALPRITYVVVAGEPQVSLDGFTSNTTRYVVQVDCWARSFNAAAALALAVRNRLKTNAASFKIVITEYPLLDDYEDDVKIYRRSVQAACWHQE